MANLVLVRHGESTWNAAGAWTGLINISIDEKGKQVARDDAEKLKNIPFDIAYTSKLLRAKQSLDEIKKTLNLLTLPTIENPALNERDYGDFTGRNKWEIKKISGEEKFEKLRRGWDVPIENGESLKDVYNRVVPYYKTQILPDLESGKNVLVVAHGNSLRALVKYLENISNEDIEKLEIATGEIYIYSINGEGAIVSKKIKSTKNG